MATKKATTAAKKSATALKTVAKKATAVKTTTQKVAAKKAIAKKKAAPTHEEIAKLAHHYFSQRGHTHGSHHDDWVRAEKELS